MATDRGEDAADGRGELVRVLAVADILTGDHHRARSLLQAALDGAPGDGFALRLALNQAYLHEPRRGPTPSADPDRAVLELSDEIVAPPSTQRAPTATPHDRLWQTFGDLPRRRRAVLAWSLLDEQDDTAVATIVRRPRWWVRRERRLSLGAMAQTLGIEVGDDADQFAGHVATVMRAHVPRDSSLTDTSARSVATWTPDPSATRNRSRRRRLAVIGLATAVLIAASIGGARLLDGDDLPPPPDPRAGEAPVGAAVLASPAPAPAGSQLVGFRRLAVLVPSSWSAAAPECGVPFSGAFSYRDEPPVRGCAASPGTSSVTFSTQVTYLPGLQEQPAQIATVDNLRVFALPYKITCGDVRRSVLVPTAGLEIIVHGPDRLTVDAIVASVQGVPREFTTVPQAEGRPIRDVVGELVDLGLDYRINRASGASMRMGAPPVTFQNLPAGRIVPFGSEVLLRIPSF